MAETVAEGPSHRTTRNLCWGVSQRGRALWARWEDTRTAIWQESAQYFFPISCKSKRKTIGIWKHLFKSLGTLSNVPLSLGVRRCWNLLLARDRKQTKKRQTMRKCTELLLHSIPSKECKQANSPSQEKILLGPFHLRDLYSSWAKRCNFTAHWWPYFVEWNTSAPVTCSFQQFPMWN